MKKILIFFLFFSIATTVAAQDFYWAVYHFEVKPGHQNDVMQAFDKFFSSETGKTMPSANFNSSLFSSSKDKWTHDLVFYSSDKNAFGEMYSGKLQQTSDFQLFGNALDDGINGVASYLGKTVLGAPVPGNRYSTAYELSVSDPATYIAAFSELRDAIIAMSDGKIGVQLHSFISGNEKGATHVATISAPDMASMLDYTDKLFASEAMATFANKVKDIRKRLRTFSTVNIRSYNPPTPKE